MTVLRSTKILLKVAAPVLLMALVASGIILYSRSRLDHLAAQTRAIVDVQSTRLKEILSIRINVNDAAV